MHLYLHAYLMKYKALGTEFATKLLVGNGRRMNKSQIYVL